MTNVGDIVLFTDAGCVVRPAVVVEVSGDGVVSLAKMIANEQGVSRAAKGAKAGDLEARGHWVPATDAELRRLGHTTDRAPAVPDQDHLGSNPDIVRDPARQNIDDVALGRKSAQAKDSDLGTTGKEPREAPAYRNAADEHPGKGAHAEAKAADDRAKKSR